jgi:hypothetical protein
VVKEVNGVNALVGPRGLTIEEGVQVDEVDLAGPANVDGMLVATHIRLGEAALLFVEIDGDAGVVARQALAGPCQLVGVPDPKVVGFTKLGLDITGVPDLLQKNALGVILGVAAVVELEEVNTKSRLREEKTYVILVDHSIGGFDDVEGVEHDVGSFAVLVKVLGALRKRTWDGHLVIVSKDDVIMPRGVE